MSVNFYKKMKVTILFMVSLFITSSLYAQLSGVKTIDPAGSGPNNYTSFASAVLDLNANGVGTGGVTFNVAAGATFDEVAVITLTTTTTDATKPIIFQASGAGNAPIVRAATGTLAPTAFGNDGDAVIRILSTDYVTFDGIEFRSNSAATTNTQLAEYGIMLVKTPTDACKNITVKNCRFSLGKTNNRSIAIYQSNLGVSGNTAITVTSIGGRSENNQYLANVITNTYSGIYLNGFAHTTAPYDLLDHNCIVGNDGMGNNISEFGGLSASPYGIYTNNMDSAIIRYNTVSGLDGTTTTGYGIWAGNGTNASVFVTRNTVTFTKANSSTSTNYAVYVTTGSSGTNNIIVADTNSVINSTFVGNTPLYGVYVSTGAKTVKIRRNIVQNNVVNGLSYLVYSSGSTSDLEMGWNVVRDNYRTASSTSSLYPVYISSSNNSDIHDNYISNNKTVIGSALIGNIYSFGGTITNNIYNNVIDSVNTISGSGSNYGIYASNSTNSNVNIYNNRISRINAAGSITNYGIFTSSGDTVNVYRNKVEELKIDTSRSITLVGIYLSSGTDVAVYNNFIQDLKTLNSFGSNAIQGIFASSTQAKIYNNTIYLNATSSTTNAAGFGSTGINITTTPTNVDLRNNIIVNKTLAVSPGKSVGIRRAATAVTGYNPLSNNNIINMGMNVTNVNPYYFDGTNVDTTIDMLKARLAPAESNSLTEEVPFINDIAAPFDLHINPIVATRVESGASPIAEVTQDFDGDPRHPSTPDIGADEGVFTAVVGDFAGPQFANVSITPNTYQCTAVPHVITATITDNSGVASASILWTVDGVAQSPISMVRGASNVWTGTIPAQYYTNKSVRVAWNLSASDSALTPNANTFLGGNYKDADLYVDAGYTGTDTVNAGVTLQFNAKATPTVVSAGVGVNTSSLVSTPFYRAWGGNKRQFLYRASELSAGGLPAGGITSLTFDVFTANTMTPMPGFTVYIDSTAVTATGTSYLPYANQIFGPANYTAVTGLNTFNLQTPFVWNGTSNIIVTICWSDQTAGGQTNTLYVKTFTTSYNSVTYNNIDNQTPAAVCATASGTSSTTRPDILFGYMPARTFTWSGTSSNILSATNIVNPTATIPVAGNYQFIVTVNDGTCSNSDTVALVALTPQAPVAAFTANDDSVAIGGNPQTVTFTDQSTNVPDKWKWEFTPNTVLFMNGTNDSSQNPQVQFTASGPYSVKLTASNAGGSDDTLRANYIKTFVTYCAAAATSTVDDDIGNVTLRDTLTQVVLINNGVDTPTIPRADSKNTYTNWTDSTFVPVPNVYKGGVYNLSVGAIWEDFRYACYVSAYIDFNKNGSFEDPGELINLGAISSSTAATNKVNRTFTIPCTADTGIVRMRILLKETTTIATIPSCSPAAAISWGEVEDYNIRILPTTLTYNTSTVDHSVLTDLEPGTNTRNIIRVKVAAAGCDSTLTATNFLFNTTGTTNLADISNIKLWYTGNSNVFAATQQVGATTTPAASFTINPNINLLADTNYFWLTYDINANATLGNFVDAECTSITLNGASYTPTITAPGGSRKINFPSTVVAQSTSQITGNVELNSNNNPIIETTIEMTTIGAQVNLSDVKIALTGTTRKADLKDVKVWFGGSNRNINQAVQFDSTRTVLINDTLTFADTVQLALDTNYVWVTVGIKDTAKVNNFVDAEIISYRINGVLDTPLNANPIGNRKIVAPYCPAAASFTGDEDIGLFQIGSFVNGVDTPINNNPLSVNTYSNFTNLSGVSAQKAVPTPLRVAIINSGSLYTTSVNIFIDYNQNGTFDLPQERVSKRVLAANIATRSYSDTITVPIGALTGRTRMRVMASETSVIDLDPCVNPTWGEVEDYTIDILPPPPGDFYPPTISNIVNAEGDSSCAIVAHNISVTVFDTTGVGSVTLNWSINNVAQTPIVMTTTGSGVYTAQIPASGANTVIYSFTVVDNSPNLNTATYDGGSYIDGILATRINRTPDGVIGVGGSYQLNAVASQSKPLGTGTTQGGTGLTPFSQGWEGQRTQYLITAALMNQAGYSAGLITGYGIEITSGTQTIPFEGYTIKMANTSTAALTPGTFDATPLTTVFGPTQIPQVTAPGVRDFAFSTPFVWDGTSNVLVEVCFDNDPAGSGGVRYTGTSTVRAMTTSYTSVIGRYADNTPLCGTTNGTSVSSSVLPAFRFSQPITATYSWTQSPNGGLSATNIFNPVATPTGGLGTYQYIVTVDDGRCTANDTVIVNVVPPPTVNLGPDRQLCSGQSLTLDAGNPGSTYSWSTGATTQTIDVVVGATYIVAVTNQAGLVGRDTILITQVASPVVNLGADDTVCAGTPVTLNAGNPGSTYLWNTGATTQTISVTQSGTYRVAVTNTNNCTVSDSVVITVKPAPVVNLGADQQICPGESVTLDAGNSGATYAWSTGATTQTINVTQLGQYIVVVTDTTGCIGRDTVNVTSKPLPVVNAGPDLSKCPGDSVTIDAGAGFTAYLWNTGATTQTIRVSTAAQYIVTVTNAEGCSASDTVNVSNFALPVVNLGNDRSICTSDTITLDAGNVGSTYLWSTGATTQTIRVSAAGTYSVTVTSPNGCESSDQVVINNLPQPDASFTAAAVDTTRGQQIQFNAVVVAGNAYSWNFGDPTSPTNTSLQPNPIHVYTTPGSYTVTLTVTNVATNCISISTQTILVSAVGNNFAKIFNLHAAPNPFVGNTKIKYTLPEDAKNVSIEVYDMLGRKISTIAKEENQVANTEYEFDFNNSDTETNSGMYLVKLIVDGKQAITRVIDVAKR